MRKLAIATIALIAIFTNVANTFGQSYPWSAESTPTNRDDQSVPPAYNPYQGGQRLPQQVPQRRP